MSDTPDQAAPAADPPPTSTATSPPAASQPPAGDAAGGDPFAELPDEPLFPRSYVEKLRVEGHKYRTEAQNAAQRAAEYDSVYGVYEEPDRQVWFDLARTWAADPNRAAQVMLDIGNSVLGENKPATNSNADHHETEPFDSGELTPDQVQQMIDSALATQAQSAAEQRAIEDIYAKVRAHGYDPESREGFMVLWTANNETDGDLDAAVDKIKQYRQGIIDDYVAGRSGAHPTPAPVGGVAANQQLEISSFDDARKATEAFLRGQRSVGA